MPSAGRMQPGGVVVSINVLSVLLLAEAIQALVLAACLSLSSRNRIANRILAGLIVSLGVYMIPYIIGYAGAYDRWPWLSFAPFNVTLLFGPLLLGYSMSLTGARPSRGWLWHLAPFAFQFLAQALVFPFPLETKNAWNYAVNEPFVVPLLNVATLISLVGYGCASWRRDRDYRAWLQHNRADGETFDPRWIRNALVAVMIAGGVWLGFVIARLINPKHDYFDDFWLYVGIGLLAIYLGVEGWRHANSPFPGMAMSDADPERDVPDVPPSGPDRDWAKIAAEWAGEVDRLGVWRDPEISLATMARALGTNSTYLSRALNEGLGVSFHTFVNQRRIAAVKALLADPKEQRDLLTLALEVGFNSKASFNRVFADMVGMTPSDYRRSQRVESSAHGKV